jgi:murein DD-endopeptidase MepM/ murein hydrolase activator NlpD
MQPQPVAQPMPSMSQSMPQAVPVQNTARVHTPAKDNPEDADAAAEPAAPATAAGPGFRWPARGRVITGFGPKPTGQQNDGINLAVPEGTPVKASDDGVVAYAGNELKGYGNLVLVRHSNGYVTAYAHASELLVKRGDSVKRGQLIAKSGQTGNVTSPQLHFEIRKGATPVDPMQFLTGAT